MIRFLRNIVAKSRIKKVLLEEDRLGHVGLEKLQKILIVLNLDEKRIKDLVEVKNMIKKSCPSLKQVVCLGYTNLKQKKYPSNYIQFAKDADNHILGRSKWTFAYKIKKQDKKLFDIVSSEYDLLIVLNYNEKNYPIKRLQTDIKSKFKVGYFAELNKPHFDFMLSTSKGSKAFVKEMLHYLKMIR